MNDKTGMTSRFVFECFSCGVQAKPGNMTETCPTFASAQPHHWKAYPYDGRVWHDAKTGKTIKDWIFETIEIG